MRALDYVIDVNFYPTEAARTANARHRPVGLGVMGLQYALYRKGVAFDSEEAARVQRRADGGDRLLRLRGVERPGRRARHLSDVRRLEVGPRAAAAGHGRPARGRARPPGRGAARRQLDWSPLREKIAAQGMRNSNVLAIAPTATISNIMGTLALHRAAVQEPVRQVEPLRRVRGPQPVPGTRPQDSEASGAATSPTRSSTSTATSASSISLPRSSSATAPPSSSSRAC